MNNHRALPGTYPRTLATCLESYQMTNWIYRSYSRKHSGLSDFGTVKLSVKRSNIIMTCVLLSN